MQILFRSFVLIQKNQKIKTQGCFHPRAIAPPPLSRASALIVSNQIALNGTKVQVKISDNGGMWR
jgi:hypothetical protein